MGNTAQQGRRAGREGTGKGTLLLGGIRVLCTEYGPYRGMRAPTIGKKWIELSQPLVEKHQRHFLLVFLPLFQVRQLKDMATRVVLYLPRLERLRLEYPRMKAEPMRSCSAQLYGTGGHAARPPHVVGEGERRGGGGRKPTSKQAINRARAEVLATAPTPKTCQPASDPARQEGIPIQKDKNQQGTIGF